MRSGRLRQVGLGLVCWLLIAFGAAAAPLSSQGSLEADEPATAPAVSSPGPSLNAAAQPVSTGSKSMDALLNAKISASKSQQSESSVAAVRSAASATEQGNRLDAVTPLSGEAARTQGSVKDWGQPLANSDRDTRPGGLPGGMNFGGRSSSDDGAGGESPPPAPPSGLLAWPMALIALIRENRVLVLGVAVVLLIMSAVFVSRQGRSRN